MGFTKEDLETEIKNSEITIEKLEKGLELNKMVKEAFEEKLSLLK